MAKNKEYYDKKLADIKLSDDYVLMTEVGLSITDIDARLMAKEELFMSNLPKYIPIFKQAHAFSERAYSGFLNELRVNVFRDGVKELEKAGITFRENPKAYKELQE